MTTPPLLIVTSAIIAASILASTYYRVRLSLLERKFRKLDQ
ncbi:hypothetical protein [Tunturiibacter gelidiferens]